LTPVSIEGLILHLNGVTSLLLNAQIAQSVEQRIENPRVRGSIPRLGTIYSFKIASLIWGFFMSVIQGIQLELACKRMQIQNAPLLFQKTFIPLAS
jgi:hypothetical protein